MECFRTTSDANAWRPTTFRSSTLAVRTSGRVLIIEERRFAGTALALLVALVMSLVFVMALVTARDAATEKGIMG